jgi:hypothetical protein
MVDFAKKMDLASELGLPSDLIRTVFHPLGPHLCHVLTVFTVNTLGFVFFSNLNHEVNTCYSVMADLWDKRTAWQFALLHSHSRT